jgi:hypothetical protein
MPPALPNLEPLVIDRPIPPFEPKPDSAKPYRPDSVLDGWSTEHFTIRAASLRGYSHRYRGQPRQDDFAVTVLPVEGALLVAVADGVSSAEKSHLGSTMACRFAIEWMTQNALAESPPWPELLRGAAWQLVEYARLTLGETEEEAPTAAERLLATTLVAGIVRPSEDGTAVVSVVQAGDSTAWVLGPDGYDRLIGGKQEGEGGIASSLVTGLPRVPHTIEPVTAVINADQVLLVGSDGFGDPLGDGSGLVGQVFAQTLQAPTPLSSLGFAHLLDFSRETFDDDRTLVAIWPRARDEAPVAPDVVVAHERTEESTGQTVDLSSL